MSFKKTKRPLLQPLLTQHIYPSSYSGEYNPGGGKDEVLKYLNEAKKQVIQAKSSLEKIMDALDLKA